MVEEWIGQPRQRRRYVKAKVPGIERPCQLCGNKYRTARANQRYCSAQCKGTAKKRRQRAKAAESPN